MRRWLSVIQVLICVLILAPSSMLAIDWPQWGLNAQHTSFLPDVEGQQLNSILWSRQYDFVAPSTGDLLIHYASPLVDTAGNIYMTEKIRDGSDIHRKVNKFDIDGNLLCTYESEYDVQWRPAPVGWEPVFHPLLANGKLYVPGARGVIHVVDPTNCTQVSTISSYEIPEDPTIRQQLLTSVFQAGVPAADSAGNVYYAVWARPGNPLALLSHFVKVTADGTVSSADYPALTLDPDQRPALNAAAAIDTNGTIYAISRGNNPIGGASNGWVLALDQGLNLLWMGSLRSDVTHIAQVNDNSSSTPVIGFDGRVFYGGWNSNGRSRGYLYSFSPSGDFLGYFDFGWDTTPGVYPNPNYPDSGPMYYLVEKDNHYSFPPPDGPYYMSSINPDTMSLECQYELVGREWCVNSVAIDRNGIVYGDGEDGFIYRIEGLFPDAAGMCNVSATRLFARQARDAAYTPTAMHPQTGKIITVNDRFLFVVGN